jgi:PPP family 3-phenylpropionic acid transporter
LSTILLKTLLSSQQTYLALFFAAYFGFVGLYSPFLGPYLKSIGHDLDVVAFTVGMMQFMRIVGPFLWGSVSDYTHSRVRWIRVGSFLGFLFSIFSFYLDQSIGYLIFFILLMNLSVSGLVPMSDALCMELCQGDLGRYGRLRVFGSLGFVLTVVMFGFVADHFGYGSYPIWVALSLLFSFVFSFLFHDVNEKTSPVLLKNKVPRLSFTQEVYGLFSSALLCRFWLASFFMVLSHGVFYAYYSLYLLENGYTERSVGGLWAFGVFCEVLFFVYQSRILKVGSLRVWLAVSYGLCALRFLLTAMYPQSAWLMLLSQGFHAFTFAAHHSASIAWLSVNVSSTLRVRGQAMYACIAYGLGGSAGTLLGRYVWEGLGYEYVFYLASLSGVLAFLWGFKLNSRSDGG